MAKIKEYSDASLVELLRQTKLEAFEEIYTRYWKKLYSTAFKRIQSREISEELVQDIFTSLWINRETASIEILSAYLFTAIKYKVINHLQKEMSKRSYINNLLHSSVAVDNSTEELVLLNDLNAALEREIQKLPARRQLIFKLSRQENLSMKQTASHLGISEKTVENQLGKAIKELKLNLKHFNIFVLSLTILLP